MKQKAKTESIPVVVRLPRKLVSALDKAAAKNCRSRSKEVWMRIQRSLQGGEA